MSRIHHSSHSGGEPDAHSPWPEAEKTPLYGDKELQTLASEPPGRSVMPRRAAARQDSRLTPTGVRLRPSTAAHSGSRLPPPIPLEALRSPSAALPPNPFVPPVKEAKLDPLGLEISELRRDPRVWLGDTERALALVAITGGLVLIALLYFGGFLEL